MARSGGGDDTTNDDVLTLSFTSTDGDGDDGDDDGEAGADAVERVLVLDETVQIRRAWSHEYAAGLSSSDAAAFLDTLGGANVLCYEFHPSTANRKTASGAGTEVPFLLTGLQLSAKPSWRDGKRLSAESIEAVLLAALSTRKISGGGGSTRGKAGAKAAGGGGAVRSVSLADVFDPDRPDHFVAKIQALVGPLVLHGGGASPGGGTGMLGGGDSPDLLTPMKGLNLT